MKKCLFPCLRMKKSLMRYLFTWFFFLTTLDCLVSYGPRCEKNCFRGWGGGCFDKECFKPVSSAKETSLKIEISPAASLHMILSKKQKKGADQTARMRRLVCACVVHKPPEDRVSRVKAHIIAVFMIRAIVNELHPTFFLFCFF